MEKNVWCKVKQFLEVLRCEDIDRESKVDIKEFQLAKQNLCEKNTIYQQSINVLPQDQQDKIQDYIEALEDYSSEECQQSYLQGFLDCVLVLKEAGLLKIQRDLETILKSLQP